MTKTEGKSAAAAVKDILLENPDGFREVIRAVMQELLETEMDEVRRMMLNRHARYMPVLNGRMLMGVMSFYDVAKAVVDAQDFENRMLKAYIRDWPVEESEQRPEAA